MQKLYNADSAKDYEPLTDDEKSQMNETEIEKWENEIERRKSFIKILQPELEKAKQELKILEDIN